MGRMPLVSRALIVLATLSSGCPESTVERCNREPDTPECIPDAEVVEGLTYRTEQIEQGEQWAEVRVGLCGAFRREIVWLMPGGAPADGYVVQQVDISLTASCSVSDASPFLDECTDPPSADHLPRACVDGQGRASVEGFTIRFWEAFPMTEGDVRYEGSDLWDLDAQAVPRGEATIEGAARFYALEEMGSEAPEEQGGPFQRARIQIPGSDVAATSEEPAFWSRDGRATLDRRMRVSWLCCPSMSTVVEEDDHDR